MFDLLMLYCLDVMDDVMVVFRLVELQLEKEGAESRFHQQEDQLAQLQEELRRVSESTPPSDSLHMVHTHTHTTPMFPLENV